MECPICFNPFDNLSHRPLRAFCRCHQTLCESCLNRQIETAGHCPWDRTRWFGRGLLAKFVENTPKNYLQELFQKNLEEEAANSRTKRKSGQTTRESSFGGNEGALSPSEFIEEVPFNPSNVNMDEQFAILLQAEEASRMKLIVEQEEKDRLFAKKFLQDSVLETLQPKQSFSGRPSVGGKEIDEEKLISRRLNAYFSLLPEPSDDSVKFVGINNSSSSSSSSNMRRSEPTRLPESIRRGINNASARKMKDASKPTKITCIIDLVETDSPQSLSQSSSSSSRISSNFHDLTLDYHDAETGVLHTDASESLTTPSRFALGFSTTPHINTKKRRVGLDVETPDSQQSSPSWVCQLCTYLNSCDKSLCCEVCESPRKS